MKALKLLLVIGIRPVVGSQIECKNSCQIECKNSVLTPSFVISFSRENLTLKSIDQGMLLFYLLQYASRVVHFHATRSVFLLNLNSVHKFTTHYGILLQEIMTSSYTRFKRQRTAEFVKIFCGKFFVICLRLQKS